MWHMDDGMGWWMVVGSIWFVFFWAAVIWVIFTVTERIGRHGESDASAIEVFGCVMPGVSQG
jgi:hypothetical protein